MAEKIKVYTKYDKIPKAILVPQFRDVPYEQKPVVVCSTTFFDTFEYTLRYVQNGLEGVTFCHYREAK